MTFAREHGNPWRRAITPFLWAVMLLLTASPLTALAASPERSLEGGSAGGTTAAVIEDVSGSVGDPIGGERKPPKYIVTPYEFEIYSVEASGSGSAGTWVGTATIGPSTNEQSSLSDRRPAPWIWVLVPGAAGYWSFVMMHLLGAGGLPGLSAPGK